MALVPLVLSVIGALLLPFILIPLLPFFLYRFIISFLYPLFSRKILKILPPSTSIYATQDAGIHVKSNILIQVTFQEQMTYEEILEAVSKRIIEAVDARGRILYPEFTHKVIPWGGYYFWKKERNFQIRDHIEAISAGDLESGFKESFLNELMNPEQSPWKMILVEGARNVSGSGVLLFKYHHTLGDGYSILNLLMGCADPGPSPLGRRTSRLSWWKVPIFPILALYDLFQAGGEVVTSPWDKPITERSSVRIYTKEKYVRKEILTQGSRDTNTSFTATLFGVIGTAIGKFLEEDKKEKLPKYFNSVVPYPGSSTSKKLENSYGVAQLKIPIGMDVVNGIKSCETELKKVKESTSPLTILLILKLIGLLPIEGYRAKAQVPPLFISTLPGPRDIMYLNAKAVDRVNFKMHLGGDFPLIINTITYNGQLTYTLGGDENVFTRQDLENLSIIIHDEILNLPNAILPFPLPPV